MLLLMLALQEVSIQVQVAHRFCWVSPITGQIKVLCIQGGLALNNTVTTAGPMTMVD
jgi:Tfp pilus assembly protein PilZ